jgi:tetratricopeptide (TPR) repeat protein
MGLRRSIVGVAAVVGLAGLSAGLGVPAAVQVAGAATAEPEPPAAPVAKGQEGSSRVPAEKGGIGAGRLRLVPLDREPKEGNKKPTAEQLQKLRAAVEAAPRDREKRFELVRALMNAGELEGALRETKKWREKDAYNLVVVRLLGDIHTAMGHRAEARRAYSAVVELLPGDGEAQRALATVLKQAGDLEGARQRLAAAAEKGADDSRLLFELADIEQRLGKTEAAASRFRTIIDASSTAPAVRYPASQRLSQIHAALRRRAISRGDAVEAKRQTGLIDALGVKGGVENDVKIYLTWDTDKSDVDLWVRTPTGEVVKYNHRKGQGGEALFDDVTSGYGPESFTAKKAQAGRYEILVNYFGARRSAFNEARGEVTVVLAEGTALEKKQVLPYRLFQPTQTVTVAAIDVE